LLLAVAGVGPSWRDSVLGILLGVEPCGRSPPAIRR